MVERESMKKKLLIITGAVLVVFIGLIAYYVVNGLNQEEDLKKEIVNLTNKDLDKGDFSINVVTEGDYAYVEEAIKKYYKQLSDNIKSFSNSLDDEKFNTIFDPSNFEEIDTIEKNIEVVDKIIIKVKNNLKEISSLCEEETIINLIDKNKIDDYYFDLYKTLMYNEDSLSDLQTAKNKMEKVSVKIENYLNKTNEILKFMYDNYDDWYVEEEQFYFSTDQGALEYNTHIDELYKLEKKIAED